ncbi:hypothetical protein B0H21DRAFT_363248 [Amylocystis lapponica]|nr:hypothetical protein B0H21DRAFT_363248 [Amylocystis lapponica]
MEIRTSSRIYDITRWYILNRSRERDVGSITVTPTQHPTLYSLRFFCSLSLCGLLLQLSGCRDTGGLRFLARPLLRATLTIQADLVVVVAVVSGIFLSRIWRAVHSFVRVRIPFELALGGAILSRAFCLCCLCVWMGLAIYSFFGLWLWSFGRA